MFRVILLRELSGGIHCQSGLPSLDLLGGCRGAARWLAAVVFEILNFYSIFKKWCFVAFVASSENKMT